MPEIKLKDVTKRWGKFYAVDHLDLEIEDNSFITLLGPSGCGKTTTLRMLATLIKPDEGDAVLDGRRGVFYPIKIKTLSNKTFTLKLLCENDARQVRKWAKKAFTASGLSPKASCHRAAMPGRSVGWDGRIRIATSLRSSQ